VKLYTRFNGGNNGALHLSMNEAAEVLGVGKATVQRAFDDLVEKGFIALEQEGNWYDRRTHEWRLTTKHMHTRQEKTNLGSETDPSVAPVVPFENSKAVIVPNQNSSGPFRADPSILQRNTHTNHFLIEDKSMTKDRRP